MQNGDFLYDAAEDDNDDDNDYDDNDGKDDTTKTTTTKTTTTKMTTTKTEREEQNLVIPTKRVFSFVLNSLLVLCVLQALHRPAAFP